MRVRSVPWYTACFGIGTGGSFALMGVLLAYADWRLAAYLGAGGAMLAAMLVLFLVQPCPDRALASRSKTKRHPLDLRPAFRKPVALGYILAYGTHTYELFAFRTWSFRAFGIFGQPRRRRHGDRGSHNDRKPDYGHWHACFFAWGAAVPCFWAASGHCVDWRRNGAGQRPCCP